MRCTGTTFRQPQVQLRRAPRRSRRPARCSTSHDPVPVPSAGRWREARISRASFAVRATVPTVQMNLLFDDIEVIETAGDPAAIEVRGIAYDSRRVEPGDLFCC